MLVIQGDREMAIERLRRVIAIVIDNRGVKMSADFLLQYRDNGQ